MSYNRGVDRCTHLANFEPTSQPAEWGPADWLVLAITGRCHQQGQLRQEGERAVYAYPGGDDRRPSRSRRGSVRTFQLRQRMRRGIRQRVW